MVKLINRQISGSVPPHNINKFHGWWVMVVLVVLDEEESDEDELVYIDDGVVFVCGYVAFLVFLEEEKESVWMKSL